MKRFPCKVALAIGLMAGVLAYGGLELAHRVGTGILLACGLFSSVGLFVDMVFTNPGIKKEGP